ncbi:MAG: hypothetical protein V4693_23470 [Pseudomonadota bacterium]
MGFGFGSGAGTATGPTGGGITIGGRGSGSGAGCVLTQPASAKATAPGETSKLRRVANIRMGMWILMVEAAVALFLLVFIVWWTMYSGPKATDDEQEAIEPPKADKPDRLDGPQP